MIATRGLTKTYRTGEHEVMALADITVDIARGEFVAVVGPSGSGKSTFMSLLGGLEAPTSGQYWLAGQPLAEAPDEMLSAIRNRQIGFVFQDSSLLARMSAVENVELPLLYAGTPARKGWARALAKLAQVGLADRAGHWPSQLSGGEKQRVAIARALANDPALLLADEPTGALDTRTGLALMELLQQLHGEGLTVVLVTHDVEIAAFASRVLFFRDGRMVGDEPNRPCHCSPLAPKAYVGGTSA